MINLNSILGLIATTRQCGLSRHFSRNQVKLHYEYKKFILNFQHLILPRRTRWVGAIRIEMRNRKKSEDLGDSGTANVTREASEKEMRLDALRVAFTRAMRAVEQSRPLVCDDDKCAAEAMNSCRGTFVPFRDPAAGRKYLQALLVHDNILRLLLKESTLENDFDTR